MAKVELNRLQRFGSEQRVGANLVFARLHRAPRPLPGRTQGSPLRPPRSRIAEAYLASRFADPAPSGSVLLRMGQSGSQSHPSRFGDPARSGSMLLRMPQSGSQSHPSRFGDPARSASMLLRMPQSGSTSHSPPLSHSGANEPPRPSRGFQCPREGRSEHPGSAHRAPRHWRPAPSRGHGNPREGRFLTPRA